jgi:hypothetical protein
MMQRERRMSVEYDPTAAPRSPEQPSSPATTTSMQIVWQRMLRVLTLDRSVYAEVERDPAGTPQAARVVAFVAASAALGTVLLESWQPGAILGAVLAALLHWLLWSGLAYLLGMVLFRKRLSFTRLVRALGYAQTPQLLAALAFVPVVGVWIVVGSRLLALIAGNLAMSDAFGIRLPQALAIRLLSFGVALAAAAGVRAVLGDVSFVMALLKP